MPAHDPEDAKCWGNPAPFDVLIDENGGPTWTYARRVAAELCRSCPIQRTCHAVHQDEQWVRALNPHRRPPTMRDTCGRPHGYKAHYRHGEDACGACKAKLAEADKRKRDAARAVKRAESDPAWARTMHAAFDRLKNRGAEISDEVRAGERAYQTLRARKQRKAAAA